MIIADKNYYAHSQFIDNDVLRFLDSLDDASYYIPIQANQPLALDAPCEVLQEEPQQEVAPQVDTLVQETKQSEENFISTETPKIGVKVVGKIDLSKFDKPKPKKKEKDGCYIIDTNVFV